jgi:ketosteroid isomerase-like protein
MSTQTNIEIAKKAYADFKAGDIQSLLAVLSDNVEWTTPGEGLPTQGVRHGKAEVAKFFETVAATWSFNVFEPREYIASGDMLAVVGSYTATAQSTGKTVSSEWVMLWRFRDGQVAAFREYTDTQALVQAITPRTAVHKA